MIWDGPNASLGVMPGDPSTVRTRGAKTVSGIKPDLLPPNQANRTWNFLL